jgi:hypothetical protein
MLPCVKTPAGPLGITGHAHLGPTNSGKVAAGTFLKTSGRGSSECLLRLEESEHARETEVWRAPVEGTARSAVSSRGRLHLGNPPQNVAALSGDGKSALQAADRLDIAKRILLGVDPTALNGTFATRHPWANSRPRANPKADGCAPRFRWRCPASDTISGGDPVQTEPPTADVRLTPSRWS